MGKMKRARQKHHSQAAKTAQRMKSKQEKCSADEEMMDASVAMPLQASTTTATAGEENPFAGLSINAMNLKQQLPDWDARSTITSKTFKGQNFTKKEKQKLRHEALMAKMNMAAATRKKAQEKKKKQRTAVVGDMSSLADALPTLDLLLKTSTGQKNRRVHGKARSIPTEKKRVKQMAEDISLFHQVLLHPTFRANAAGSVREHLKQQMEREQKEGT